MRNPEDLDLIWKHTNADHKRLDGCARLLKVSRWIPIAELSEAEFSLAIGNARAKAASRPKQNWRRK